jgi:branched-subunit amino acid aminotransferase/4-amino-4-deoxychorismate lyase
MAETASQRVLAWAPTGRLVACGAEEDRLVAADSWLLADGRVRGLDLHRERFFRACAEGSGTPHDGLRAFWRAALAELPRQGRWFPRVELSAGAPGRLRLRIRPAPPRSETLRAWIWRGSDLRTAPRQKGPDLMRLAEVRRQALAAGADEALLTTRSGVVLEATTCNVLWWEGSCLCSPSPSLRIMPGVTRQLIDGIAASQGVPVLHRRCGVQHFEGREVWLVNALHGIRSVSSWVQSPISPGSPLRLSQWQRWLEAGAASLPEAG